MKSFIFSFLILSAISFAYLGIDCTEMERMCGESACTQAGGEYSQGVCLQGANFSIAYYDNATGECAILRGQCEETGGLMMPPRDASCCGPVFAILIVLGCAVATRFK